MSYERLGNYIRDMRKSRNITQRELAERVGVNFTYISKIEHGRMDVPPSGSLLVRMAAVLNIMPDDMLMIAGKIDLRALQQLAATDSRVARLLFKIQAGAFTEAQWQVIERLI